MRLAVIILAALLVLALVVGCQKNNTSVESNNTSTPAVTPADAPVKPSVTDGKTVKTKSGLKYEEIKVGTGAAPKNGDLVVVNYTGWLKDGTVFDSSEGEEPFTFRLGMGEVIKGWDEGVASMKVGGTRKLMVPSNLAYGEEGTPGGPIPPNSSLTFEVELLDIVSTQ
ncbi:MAG: FKBP-type peptidyl-prolyl cis-trans isomerase [Armatimonadota bacterium]